MTATLVTPRAASAAPLRAVDAVQLRAGRPADLRALETFIGGLTIATRAARFFTPLATLPPPLARAIATGDDAQRFVVAERGPAIVGLGQACLDRAARAVEVALVVADALQRRGIGGAMLDRLLAEAAAAGARHALLETGAGNDAMIALARSRGFAIAVHPEDPRLRVGRRAV